MAHTEATNHGLSVGLPDSNQLSLMLQTLLHLDMSHIIDHIICYVHIYIFFLLLWQLVKVLFYYND